MMYYMMIMDISKLNVEYLKVLEENCNYEISVKIQNELYSK